MTVSRTQLVGHVLERHDPAYSFATRSSKTVIEREHRQYHAALVADHEHDPSTGRVIPAAGTLTGAGR